MKEHRADLSPSEIGMHGDPSELARTVRSDLDRTCEPDHPGTLDSYQKFPRLLAAHTSGDRFIPARMRLHELQQAFLKPFFQQLDSDPLIGQSFLKGFDLGEQMPSVQIALQDTIRSLSKPG